MLPQFEVSTFGSQIFWLIVIFAFLYVIVSRVIAPKVENILTSRNRYLEENISASEKFSDQAKTLRLQKESKLQELDAETQTLKKGTLDNLAANFLAKEEELKKALSQKELQNLAEIRKYADEFSVNKTNAILDLSAFIIEKITGKPADLALLKKIHEDK